jgi:hypothetical protein
MWAVETNADRRRILAKAGHNVSQSLQLAESDPDAAHALEDLARMAQAIRRKRLQDG